VMGFEVTVTSIPKVRCCCSCSPSHRRQVVRFRSLWSR